MAELLQVRRCEKRNRKHFCWVMLLMYTAWKYWDIRKDLKQFSTYYNSKFDYIYIYIWKQNMLSFSNETLSLLFRKSCFSCILDYAKTVWALRILSQKFTRNFVIKELWALENHELVNMLLCSSHFTEVH